jgi:hypothetical protein
MCRVFRSAGFVQRQRDTARVFAVCCCLKKSLLLLVITLIEVLCYIPAPVRPPNTLSLEWQEPAVALAARKQTKPEWEREQGQAQDGGGDGVSAAAVVGARGRGWVVQQSIPTQRETDGRLASQSYGSCPLRRQSLSESQDRDRGRVSWVLHRPSNTTNEQGIRIKKGQNSKVDEPFARCPKRSQSPSMAF